MWINQDVHLENLGYQQVRGRRRPLSELTDWRTDQPEDQKRDTHQMFGELSEPNLHTFGVSGGIVVRSEPRSAISGGIMSRSTILMFPIGGEESMIVSTTPSCHMGMIYTFLEMEVTGGECITMISVLRSRMSTFRISMEKSL